jgi:dihydrofolate reductase
MSSSRSIGHVSTGAALPSWLLEEDSAIEQAKAAAGNKAVQVVGGAGLIQQLLRANLVDELRVGVMPVVLGDGIRWSTTLIPSGSN